MLTRAAVWCFVVVMFCLAVPSVAMAQAHDSERESAKEMIFGPATEFADRPVCGAGPARDRYLQEQFMRERREEQEARRAGVGDDRPLSERYRPTLFVVITEEGAPSELAALREQEELLLPCFVETLEPPRTAAEENVSLLFNLSIAQGVLTAEVWETEVAEEIVECLVASVEGVEFSETAGDEEEFTMMLHLEFRWVWVPQ